MRKIRERINFYIDPRNEDIFKEIDFTLTIKWRNGMIHLYEESLDINGSPESIYEFRAGSLGELENMIFRNPEGYEYDG